MALKPCLTCGVPTTGSRCPQHTRKKRTKERNRPWHTANVRRARKALRGQVCIYCGNEATNVDHIVPVSRGGTDDLANLAPSCRPCNLAKADTLVLVPHVTDDYLAALLDGAHPTDAITVKTPG